jgi:hypothetical protein
MRHTLLLALILLLCGSAAAQVNISGSVRYKDTGEPAAGSNVLLFSKDGKSLLNYSSANSSGSYSINYSGNRDSLLLKVTGFNIKTVERRIKNISQKIDFTVSAQALKLDDVIVKPKAITRRSDTLSYNVSAYRDSMDFAIADVMKKMPGITVKSSGEVLYNGKSISKFYIEGMDMMGGKYGLAVNNVPSKDVAAVQVLENHQPIKAMRDKVFSDAVALNLKLRNKSKGVFAYTLTGGGGYKPLMWNAGAVLMQFKSKFQFFTTCKSNNSGSDILSEMSSLYGTKQEIGSMIDVHFPSTPNTGLSRYMDNKTQAISINSIFKLSEEKDNTLKFNLNYYHDIQKFNSFSNTVYYIDGKEPIDIKENTHGYSGTDNMDLNSSFVANNSKSYFSNKFDFTSQWDKNHGTVITGVDTCLQRMRMPAYKLRDNTLVVHYFGNTRCAFSANLSYLHLPSMLRVSPVIYPEIFGDTSSAGKSAVQNTGIDSFNASSSAEIEYKVGKFSFGCVPAVLLQHYKMTSSLYEDSAAASGAGYVLGASAPDSLNNNLLSKRLDGCFTGDVTYAGNDINIFLMCTADFAYLKINDRQLHNIDNQHKLMLSPSITVNYQIAPGYKAYAGASANNSMGMGDSNYSGYIMSEYRTVSGSEGKVSKTSNQNCYAGLDYGDAISELFYSFKASCNHARYNLMYGVKYYGSLSKVESNEIDNNTSGYTFSGQIGKGFLDGKVNISFPLSYAVNNSHVLRQGEIMKIRTRSIVPSMEFYAKISKVFGAKYNIYYFWNKSYIKNSSAKLDAVNSLHQYLDFDFTFPKGISFSISGEHYYNDGISSGSKNMFFTDAYLSIKRGKFEYMINCRNLLNTKNFRRRVFTDITDYEYDYKLRPLSVLFTVRFSLR